MERKDRSVAAAGNNRGEASIVYGRVEYLYKPNDKSRQAGRTDRESRVVLFKVVQERRI